MAKIRSIQIYALSAALPSKLPNCIFKQEEDDSIPKVDGEEKNILCGECVDIVL